MTRHFVSAALAMALCLSVSVAYGQRGRESEKPGGNKAPGGEWSERTHSGKQPTTQPNYEHNEAGTAGAEANKYKPTQASGEEGAAVGTAAANRNEPKVSGAQGAAAGAAAANNKQPQATGAQGAAAGAAAVNRNSPQMSGAQGAAVGAAAANRNSPQYSGAAGVAAGAAAANRNSSQITGAQGAALGAAAANQNASQVSGAQGAAIGAAMANQNAPQISGAQGAALGAAAANNNSPAAPGAASAAAGYAAVRNSFSNTNLHGQQWYGNNPSAWAPAGWTAGSAWRQPAWGDVATVCGYGGAPPISYDYGVNIVAQNGNVIFNGQNVGPVGEFSLQAANLAASGAAAQPSDTDQWLPLGVFAMVRNEQQHPQFIVQLAINRQGILRGNYTDDVSDNTLPIHGAVDKQTQRAAWTVGNNQGTVMEAGISDLTGNEAPALIHKNGKTDHWLLVRLTQPPQGQ
jgi:hypothetical protein